MEDKWSFLFVLVETGGIFAPLAFVAFHLLRPFLFIPVVVVCAAGGVLFGTVWGTIFSLMGLMLVSLFFYFFIGKMPGTHRKLTNVKRKWFGEYRNLTVGQVAVLRVIPFVHYHLLSFCLLERTKTFQEYIKGSFLSNLPLALFYTIFGEFISRFTPVLVAIILFSLAILVYILREKVTVIKWKEFFNIAVKKQRPE
ncbi:alkaline phosphatase [Bacillus canaveralius]|uniref:Alkaline phosphatase n=1 Tax=Bacillus canaveralius TaxID=1403243 RepID=A0A2N5GJQ4_9BACI|nr:VTT domain-containing protein [Bacillus canaveralius]PLR81507.1 alkaline phosphatase [Bacillus canaveralius]PLR93891.1 alkaline phosphatase [Bacillus canaveralius]